MKTLKKTLCLVLAMVMVFGLCSVSASAKLDSYKDKDKITYAEAVDVLSGIGILKGDTSGFRPKDSITRAEAAKIMAYIIIGDATQADAVKASTDPFPDVPATHWAAGYIAYCASAGIVGGKGDGYHPNENVTGLEFAKMLLCALGYGQKNEYVGKDWAIFTSKDAIRLGVFDDNLAGATTNPATREECALYAYNVIAKNRGTDYDDNAQYGLLKVTYSQLAGDYVANGAFSSIGSTSSVSVDANKKPTFGADYKLKARASEGDAFERETGHEWYIDIGKKDAITAKYEGGRLKAVYTTEVTYGDIYALLGSDAIKKATTPGTFKVYVDGASSSGDETASSYTKGASTKITGTGNGVETYVYQWWAEESDGSQSSHVKICVVSTFLAKVSTVTAGTAKKDPQTKVTLENVCTTGTEESGYTSVITNGYETEDFDVDDYVLVTISKNADTTKQGIQSMVAAPTLEDEITRYTMKAGKYSMVIGGTTYAYAKNSVEGTSIKSSNSVTNEIVDGDDHIIYLDSTGEYVMGIANVKESSNYVYVAQFGVKTNTDEKLTDKLALYADVYYADGTNDILTVKTTKDATTDTKTGVFKTPTALSDESTYNTSTNLGVYVLKMEKGKAILSRPDGSGPNDKEAYNAAAGTNEVNQGNATIGSKVANSKTVFFYVYSTHDKEDFKVNAYTGINNVPVVKRGNGDTKALDYFTGKSGAADADNIKAMAVESKISGGESSDTVYYYLGSASKGNWDRYLKQVVFHVYDMNGNEAEVTCDYDEVDDAKQNIADTQEAGFVKVTKGKLDYIQSHTGSYNAATPKESGDMYIDATNITALNEATAYVSTTQYALKDAKIVELRNDPDPAVSDVTSWNNVFAAAGGSGSACADKVAMAYKAKDDNNAVLVVFIIGDGT